MAVAARQTRAAKVRLASVPATEGFAQVAQLHLTRVCQQAQRMQERDADADPDALHDLRTALRRLRSWLAVWRPLLGEAARGMGRRRWKRIWQASNAARDLEVQIQALRVLADHHNAASAPEILARLERRYARALARLHRVLERELGSGATRLRRRLSTLPADAAALSRRRTGAVLAPSVQALCTRLLRDARALRDPEDVQGAHRLRLLAKRLRYVLEPFDAGSAETRRVVRHLARIQDRLGNLHDLQVLAADLQRESRRRSADLDAVIRRKLLAAWRGVTGKPAAADWARLRADTKAVLAQLRGTATAAG